MALSRSQFLTQREYAREEFGKTRSNCGYEGRVELTVAFYRLIIVFRIEFDSVLYEFNALPLLVRI